MVSRFIVRADSALPERMKVTVLSQEVLRRERNTSQNVGVEIRRDIRNRFLLKLRLSGYSIKQRMNILLSGVKGYQAMLEVEKSGYMRVNRAREDDAKGRRIRKTLGKTDWYKRRAKKAKATKQPITSSNKGDLKKKV